jgi:two-component sensor histidine kinase
MKIDNKEFVRSLTGEQVRTILDITDKMLEESFKRIQGLEEVSEMIYEEGKREGILKFMDSILTGRQ